MAQERLLSCRRHRARRIAHRGHRLQAGGATAFLFSGHLRFRASSRPCGKQARHSGQKPDAQSLPRCSGHSGTAAAHASRAPVRRGKGPPRVGPCARPDKSGPAGQADGRRAEPEAPHPLPASANRAGSGERRATVCPWRCSQATSRVYPPPATTVDAQLHRRQRTPRYRLVNHAGATNGHCSLRF